MISLREEQVSGIATLFAEELKAAMRGRFAWLGAGVILLAIGIIATVGTQDTWLDGYGIIAYGLVPLGFIPLTAGFIASPRANRFVESVFTAPVERRDWLLSKILVVVTLAVAYNVSLVPMLLVYVHHVGLPFLLNRFLLWTPGILVTCIAIGTLIGVMFIGRSVAAPAGAGMGVLLAYVGLVPLQELMVARGNGWTRSAHIALASPAVLLKNALGFTLAVGSIPATTAWTWVSLLLVTVGALALAIWIFLYAQGVETWEATPGQRWIIGCSVAALILAPVGLADTNYDKPAPPANHAPPLRIFGRATGSMTLVPSGGRLPARCCSAVLNRDLAPLGTDENTHMDLLLLLPVEATEKLDLLNFRVSGENGLQIDTAPARPLEMHAYIDDSGPAGEDGHPIRNGWIARIPAAFTPSKPWDIGGNRYPLEIVARYRTDAGERTFNARGAVEAEVSSAIYEMGAASSVLPLLCFAAAFARWRKTR